MIGRIIRRLRGGLLALLTLAFVFASVRTSIERRGSVETMFILVVFGFFLYAVWKLWKMATWVYDRMHVGRDSKPQSLARSQWIKPRPPRRGVRS
jgi:hypothetical protein